MTEQDVTGPPSQPSPSPAGTPPAPQFPVGTSLHWAPGGRLELPELSELLTEIEAVDQPSERHSLAELEESYDAEGADPGRDLVLGRAAGSRLVGYGWVHPVAADVDPRRVFLVGGVHPDWRRQGIGTAVLTWQLSRARQWYRETRQPEFGPLRAVTFTDAKLAQALGLYERAGMRPLRWFVDMSLRFADVEALPEVRPPAGIRLTPFSADLSEAVRQTHNAAFADHWGSQPVSETRWAQQHASASARPDWSWVALDGDRVVGYAMNSAYEQDWTSQGFKEGWTDQLGVLRSERGRGIAKALLAASMRSFAEGGMDAAGLGVDTDNPSGAYGLYARLGYQAGGTVVTHGLTEQP